MCIAYAESNLKEAIRKSHVVPTIASIQPSTTSPTPGPRKRRNAEHHSPSPSVAKKRRTYADSGSTAQQLLSPKSSRDSLLTQSGPPTTGRFVAGALHPTSGSTSRSVDSTQTPNPDQRLSIQPPAPRIVPNTSSRMRSDTLLEGTGQPTPSALPRKKETASGISVAPCLAQPASNAGSATPAPSNHLNHPKDFFKVPDPPRVQTPLRTGSKHLSNWSARPSAPPPSSVGLSAVRHWLSHKPRSTSLTACFFFSSHAQRRGRRFIPITNDDSDDETFDD